MKNRFLNVCIDGFILVKDKPCLDLSTYAIDAIKKVIAKQNRYFSSKKCHLHPYQIYKCNCCLAKVKAYCFYSKVCSIKKI